MRRTFHQNRHALHGITVVVDTQGPELYIGRCDDMDEREIVLLDVDVHREGGGAPSKAEYVARAAQMGVWKKHDRLALPLTEVREVRPLGEY
ncbi:MAG: hypothetical protein ACRD2Z_04065 [Thermoanaerobaculia bacterium]